MIYEFAGISLNTGRHILMRDGKEVPVEPQVFDILRVLAESAGALVTKDTLIETVWDGRIVSEATISARINAARVAVGDNGTDQAVIRTVSRRGFELVAEVAVTEKPLTAHTAGMEQTIRYATSRDGTSIAWSSTGEGPPLLIAWRQFSHLVSDFTSPLHQAMFRTLADHYRLIRYDLRGSGLSGAITDGDGVEECVDDLMAVAEAAGLESFPVLGVLQGTAFAVRAAARFPDRISHLVLWSAYARGRAIREGAPEDPASDPFITLLNSGGWGDASNGFMRAWATMVMPGATTDEVTALIELIGTSGTAQGAMAQRGLIDHLDVTGDLDQVRVPALVINPRLGAVHPIAEGRRVAAGIPGAEFIETDSANTFPIVTGPEYDRQMAATLAFLARNGGG